jgi:pyruvate formate lyase activating enzyme
MRDRCRLCEACAAACPEHEHAFASGEHVLSREHCGVCGACAAACPAQALQVKGFDITAEEIVARAVRLKPFFRHSGGGVTLTGGEVTQQVDFAEAVLAGCRAEGIHTAIETCGAYPWERLARLVEHADLILYDLKLIDPEEHRHWTGAGNEAILENARRLAGRNVEVRVPLIPGVTDTEHNLRGISEFAAEAGLPRVTRLPFNPSWAAKHEWLGRERGDGHAF